MVNIELTKRVALNLFRLGKSALVSSLYSNSPSDDDDDHDVAKTSDQSSESKSSSTKRDDAISTEYLVYNWLEAWFAWFQMIAIWHDPLFSLLVTCGLLTSFLFFTYFAPRFYATMMILLFVYNLTKVWFRHIWPEIRVPPEHEDEARLDVDRYTYLHPQLMTLDELKQILHNLKSSAEYYIVYLMHYRSRDRVQFCITICSILTITAYIGNRISGLTLIFGTLALALAAPGIYLHTLPDRIRDYIKYLAARYILRTTTVESSRQQSEEPKISASTLSSPSQSSWLSSADPTGATRTLKDILMFRAPDLFGRSPTVADINTADATTATKSTNTATPQANDEDNNVSQEISSTTNIVDRKVSSDEGSTASLIDFEDEQQDGFVIL